MKNIGSPAQKDDPQDDQRTQGPYVLPPRAVLTPDQVRLDNIRNELRWALTHLSNAQKDCDLAGIIDALELAYARDRIIVALRDCEAHGLEPAAG